MPSLASGIGESELVLCSSGSTINQNKLLHSLLSPPFHLTVTVSITFNEPDSFFPLL